MSKQAPDATPKPAQKPLDPVEERQRQAAARTQERKAAQADARAKRQAQQKAGAKAAANPGAKTAAPARTAPKAAGQKPGVAAKAAPARPGPAAPGAPAAQPQPPAKPPAAKPAAPQPAQPAPAKPPAAPPKPPGPAPAQAHVPAQPAGDVAPPVSSARLKGRHLAIAFSFLIFVVLPVALAGWYLWERAADQYASKVGFSVRKEEISSPIELLGGITDLSGSSSRDTDILYEFIQSQQLVADIDTEIDLRGLWSKPQDDVVFAFEAPGTIEDLLEYWGDMVRISYDSGAGLIEVEVRAFAAEDATRIAEKIFEKSTDMINQLSAIAREDTIRYAREELDTGVERLKAARETVTLFRNRNQLVDPTLDLQSQAGLLGSLEAQLAEAQIEVDLLRETIRGSDPRLTQAERRVEVIRARIAAERRKLGIGDQGGASSAFADLVGEYERLVVDREFAEQAYVSALAAYDAALAESRRKSRYLAAYVTPTKAEAAEYPERVTILLLLSMFLFLAWSIITMVLYSFKDRR